jgi:hypothetical protein
MRIDDAVFIVLEEVINEYVIIKILCLMEQIILTFLATA